MSLIRQIMALLATVLLLSLLGSVLITLPGTRDMLQSELRVKNTDNANLLALALSQHGGDRTTMDLLMSAQFAGGHYRALRLVDAEGRVLFERTAPPRASVAPAWFEALVPVQVDAGIAQVSDGWRAIGRVELESHVAYAHDALWTAALRTAGWLLLVGALASAVAVAGLRLLRRPLDATVAQAEALQRGEFVTVPMPRVPELRTLSASMNSLVGRLREVFDTQAQQVAALRRIAEIDPLTGLANRRHFVGQLEGRLAQPAAGSLLIVRLRDLDGLNRHHGRRTADHVLRLVAEQLQRRAEPGGRGLLGRLNGSDFALHLPGAGEAAVAGPSLVAALRAQLPALADDAAVCAGSADLDGVAQAGEALARVDAALADAEHEGAYAHVHREGHSAPTRSDDEWRRLLDAALAGGSDLSIREFPVVDARGRVVHLECPLGLTADGALAPAAQWLPHAQRHRRLPALDLRAVELALAAAARDGRTRSTHVALESLESPGFVTELRERLAAAGALARHVMLEVPERALVEHRALLKEAARQWAGTGAQVGLEHAGGDSALLAQLFDAGLSFVKIDRRHTAGLADDPQLRSFASGLAALLRGMQLRVVAEGVEHTADLQALWALGFDAATGPAVSAGLGARASEGVAASEDGVD